MGPTLLRSQERLLEIESVSLYHACRLGYAPTRMRGTIPVLRGAPGPLPLRGHDEKTRHADCSHPPPWALHPKDAHAQWRNSAHSPAVESLYRRRTWNPDGLLPGHPPRGRRPARMQGRLGSFRRRGTDSRGHSHRGVLAGRQRAVAEHRRRMARKCPCGGGDAGDLDLACEDG